jgi:NitT/TauT family transport system substrate-binding protein
MRRLLAIVGVTLAVMLFGVNARAEQLTTLTLRMAWVPYAFHLGMFYGLDRGWFREAGLDLEPEDGTGSVASVSLTGNGKFDIGETAVAVMAIARGKGMPLKAIGTFVPGTDLGVMVPRGAGLKTPKDLEGKKLGYTASSYEAPFIESFLKAGGADPNRVELVNLDPAAKIPTYAAGRVDAMISSVPANLASLEKTRPSDTIMFSDYGFNLPTNGFCVTEQTLRSKRKELRAFIDVMRRSFQDILEGGQLEAAIASEIKLRPNANLSASDLRAQMEVFRPFFYTPTTKGKPHGWQSSQDWKDAIVGMQKVGLIPASLKPEDFYTNELFE